MNIFHDAYIYYNVRKIKKKNKIKKKIYIITNIKMKNERVGVVVTETTKELYVWDKWFKW